MAFFGPLIGYGSAGLVFDHSKDKDQVIKLVYLPDRDPVHWEEFANQQQSKLFEDLSKLEVPPTGLPKVTHYMEGTVGPWLEEEVTDQIADPEAQQIFNEEFTPGRKFGLWMMEKVPHREENKYGSSESPNENIPEGWSLDPETRMGWRTRDYQDYVPIEQGHYRDMSTWLLNNGYLVRDVKQLRNLGYRHEGTPVWYDPNVVTWPLQTSEDRDAFDTIFSGFTPEYIQNEINSGQYVENRRNAESRFDSVNDFELLQTFQVVKSTMSINWFVVQQPSPAGSTMQGYIADPCNITKGDHDYGPAYEWEQESDDMTAVEVEETGEHYQITCQKCGLMASAGIDMSANGLDKILTFYDWGSNGEKVWQDPYKDIWYSHTKPPILDAAGDIDIIPY